MARKTVQYSNQNMTYTQRANEMIRVAKSERPFFPYTTDGTKWLDNAQVDYYQFPTINYGTLDTSSCWFFYQNAHEYDNNVLFSFHYFIPILQNDVYRPFISVDNNGLCQINIACAYNDYPKWTTSNSYKAIVETGTINALGGIILSTNARNNYKPSNYTTPRINKDRLFEENITTAYGTDIRCRYEGTGNNILDGYDNKFYSTLGINHYTNIPIFMASNRTGIRNWVLNGDRSGEIIFPFDGACEFGLWIDGTNSPSYKVNWHIADLEEEGYNFDNAVVKIGIGERTSSGVYHHTLTEKPYNDGSVRFTWFDFEDLGVKASLLSPWLNLNAQVILEDGTVVGTPTIDLRQKAPNFDGMWRDNAIGEDGSQFIVNQGSGEDSDDYHEPEDEEDAGQSNTDMNVSGAVISCYKISRTELHKLSQELWSSDFIDNIRLVNNNPIENIVSLKSLPIAISGGTSEHIKLGNVETTASGNKCNESYSIEVGSLAVTGRYGNFLDYAPFTSVNIYLPFIGMQSLDTNIVMNRTISVKYIVDCVTGSLRVKISSNGRALYEFNGCIGVDLPISSSNRAQVEMGLLSSGLGMVGSVASGNLLGAVGSGLAMANSQYHTQTSGTASAVIGFHDVRECFIRIDSPVYEELKDFNKTHGRMCNLSLNLNSLRGFTKVADGVELNNIPCTNEEKELIHDYLINGIII